MAPMKLNLCTLASATLATTLLLLQSATVARAGGTEFSGSVMDTSKGYDLGTGKFQSFPFHVSVSVRGGYDDNVNLSSIDEQGSGFINTQLGVTYVFGSPRTQLSLNAGAGLTYYFDRNNDAFGD